MTELGLITPALRELVGKAYARRVSHVVSSSDIRKWAIAVHYPQPAPARYLQPTKDLAAPLDFNPFAWGAAQTFGTGAEIDTDPELIAVGALEHLLGVPPPELRRALNGGVSCTYTGTRIRAGDTITAVDTIGAYYEREGRLGPMLTTSMNTTWTNANGDEIKTHSLNLIRY